MTNPEIVRASARAKAQSKAKSLITERDADVRRDCIVDQEDTCTQWLNRYSATSLRWPMFDCTSLLSWVWGLPMVVPNEKLGDCFNMVWCSVVCFVVTGVCLSVCLSAINRDDRHRIPFDLIVRFRTSSSLSLLTGSIRHRASSDVT